VKGPDQLPQLFNFSSSASDLNLSHFSHPIRAKQGHISRVLTPSIKYPITATVKPLRIPLLKTPHHLGRLQDLVGVALRLDAPAVAAVDTALGWLWTFDTVAGPVAGRVGRRQRTAGVEGW
jgi:hypothetical protein